MTASEAVAYLDRPWIWLKITDRACAGAEPLPHHPHATSVNVRRRGSETVGAMLVRFAERCSTEAARDAADARTAFEARVERYKASKAEPKAPLKRRLRASQIVAQMLADVAVEVA